jgi:hypothetical protein
MKMYVIYYKLFNSEFQETEPLPINLIAYRIAQLLEDGYNDVRIRIA